MMATTVRRAARIGLVALAALLAAGVLPVSKLTTTASAGMKLDIDKELSLLRDGRAQVHIGKARYRFAVFSFDDPDGTGLGNAVAGIRTGEGDIVSREFLGSVFRYRIRLGGGSLIHLDEHKPAAATLRREGERVRFLLRPADVMLFPATDDL